jgi:predicted RNA methylase
MDYARFYNEQPDYVAFRSDKLKQEEYRVAVDWKLRELCRLIPDNFRFNNILEVGCAFGILLNCLADKLQIKRRFGIDISSENIEAAKKIFPDCSFFQGTIEEFIKNIPLGIQNSRFDLIVLSDIVEHIPHDLGFLKTVRKMASYLILNLPLEKSFKTRNRHYGEQDLSGHLRCYDKELAVRLVTSAGFEVVNSFTSIAFYDMQVYKVYKKNRTSRISIKPLPLRLFWTVFYFLEDKIKLANEKFSEKISGTNYFALLKSNNEHDLDSQPQP